MATPQCTKTIATADASKNEKKAARCYLPDNYGPHEHDVLIGRGRRVDNHKGNHRFKSLIRTHGAAYYNARTKTTKTSIILHIFQNIKRTAEAEGGGGFIKQESSSKRWFVIDDSSARISIAQVSKHEVSSTSERKDNWKATSVLTCNLRCSRLSVTVWRGNTRARKCTSSRSEKSRIAASLKNNRTCSCAIW
jgi:hypothetical protein